MANYLEPDFAVRGQIAIRDIDELISAGFKTIINNRPDGEIPSQPTSDAIEAAVKAAGLTYAHIPMAGPLTLDLITASQDAISTLPRPILAFCGSGQRSSVLWCFANAQDKGVEGVISAAADAGYQLSMIRDPLTAWVEQSTES